MTSLLYKMKYNLDDWNTGTYAEVDDWFLMSSPSTVLGIALAYLVFVLKLGPMMMRDRKPFSLRRPMIWYNGLQVMFSLFLVYKAVSAFVPIDSSLNNTSASKVAKQKSLLLGASWYYFFAKVTELLDTVFFVLRKRSSQISFLHVYHHSIVMLFSWCFLKYMADQQGVLVGLINSSVHVIMYFYYMLAAMGPAYRKYLWWKKYMTVMQLIQFVIIIGYMASMAFNNHAQRSVSYFFLVNAVIFLYLFGDFYRKAYVKGGKREKSDLNANTETAPTETESCKTPTLSNGHKLPEKDE